jgi:hypothetical protein
MVLCEIRASRAALRRSLQKRPKHLAGELNRAEQIGTPSPTSALRCSGGTGFEQIVPEA